MNDPGEGTAGGTEHRGRVDRWLAITRAIVNGIQSDQVTFIAASLAYYAFVSLVPLLLLALVTAAAFGTPEIETRIVESVTGSLGPSAGGLVQDALGGAGAAGATAVGLIALLWSALKLFRGLDVAFALVYGSPGPSGIVEQVIDGIIALATVGGGIAATIVVGALVSFSGVEEAIGGADVLGLVGSVGLFGGLVITFLPLYYVLPDREMTVREAIPGALLAAGGWTALMTGFRAYAANAASFKAYGVLGAVLLLVTFLYFGALVLLLGVVFNAVLANRVGPDPGLDTVADGGAPDESGEVELSLPGEFDVPDVSDADDEELAETVDRLHERLSEFEERVEDRTVRREQLERDLQRYVRQRMRSGKARGWGPYLVLLYGTAMTLGAFVYLSGLWAVLAMVIIWLSTLGLYALMLIVGVTVSAASLPGRLKDRLDSLR